MKQSVFGLIAQLATSRITLPLIHVETRFRVTGEVVLVEMDQVFEQNACEPLDVTYTFPLPGSASVHRCEMIVNGRVTRAVVMEEQDARRTVAEKKAAGHRTALVEMDRDNVFTLQLGNTAPGDHIVIRFAYFQMLDRLGEGLSLRIPFCPGIRYIPGKPLLRKNRGLGTVDDTDQVPDASRITPPRIGADHPDAATIFLHGSLDASEVELTTCFSPSNPAVIRAAGATLEVELAGEQHFPDRDFVLRWQETAVTEAVPRAWTTRHNGDLYALLQLRAPRVEAAQAAVDDFAQDIYFLLDRSGSMSGGNWEKAAEALHAFVRELGANDRVWITCFESGFQDFSDSLMSRDELLTDEGFIRLAEIGTGGGTELLPALRHVLDVRAAQQSGRPERFVLITDGQVGNENEILKLVGDVTMAGVTVHTFGIDCSVNDAFLKNLARLTGGRCALLTPDDDIPAAVKDLAVILRRPVLTGLRLASANVDTACESDRLPDLHAGDVHLVPVRLPADEAATLTIHGHHPDDSEWSMRFDLGAESPGHTSEAARLLWAHRRCRHLLGNERAREGIEVAIAHNLVCKGTSFVAWDEAEKVTVAKREVYQPSMGIEFYREADPFEDFEDFVSKGPATQLRYSRYTSYMCCDDVDETPSRSDIAATSSAPPRAIPRLLKTLIDEISPRYHPWPNDAECWYHAKAIWMDECHFSLIWYGLRREVAYLLTLILGQWCWKSNRHWLNLLEIPVFGKCLETFESCEWWMSISQRRQRRFLALLKHAESAEGIRVVLANLPPSQAVSDAIQLIDATLANLPPSEADTDSIQLVDAAPANAPRKTCS